MRKSILEFGNDLHMIVSTHEGVPRGGHIFGLRKNYKSSEDSATSVNFIIKEARGKSK